MKSLNLLSLGVVVGLPLVATACGGGSTLPPPRSVIVYTGVRIQADIERMEEIDRWLEPQLEVIRRGRDLTLRTLRTEGAEYPWQSLDITGDTVRIFVQQIAPDTRTPFAIYGYHQLLAREGGLERWIPEAEVVEGFDLERAILNRVAEIWLLGRSVHNTQPYGPLDELLYANEYGFLDEFILAAQPERFQDERRAHREANPERWEEFQAWFQETFERDGPGYVREANGEDEEGDEPPPGAEGRR
jgi:hypothetical protein